jgi:hypothetical protein
MEQSASRRSHWRQINLGWPVLALVVAVVMSLAPNWLKFFGLPVGVLITAMVPAWWGWKSASIVALAILYFGAIEGSFRLSRRQFQRFDLDRAKVLDEVVGLRRELKALSERFHARNKSQAISDALRARHAEGTALANQKVTTDVTYEAWKQKWRDFETSVLGDMKRLECSDSEIHGFRHIGPVPKTPILGGHEKADRAKGRLIAQLDHIDAVAKSHDKTRPV